MPASQRRRRALRGLLALGDVALRRAVCKRDDALPALVALDVAPGGAARALDFAVAALGSGAATSCSLGRQLPRTVRTPSQTPSAQTRRRATSMMMLHDESEPWTYIFSDDRDDAAPPAPIVRRVNAHASRARAGYAAGSQRLSDPNARARCSALRSVGRFETAKIVISRLSLMSGPAASHLATTLPVFHGVVCAGGHLYDRAIPG